ncbi:MAG TPA: TonB-dependent receptor [Bryobacteraceae bacterium]|nr:TonB-dependent receptor [Bryobacteraceae bacterium]
MSLRLGLFAGALAVLLGIACQPASAQLVSGNITGTVYDATGAAVPNATVIAHNDATGVDVTTTASSAGEYRISNLPVGTYTLSGSAKGFSKTEVKGAAIALNVTATINLTLQVGATATTVEVTEAIATVDTTSAQLQNTFTTQQMMDLPTASGGSGVINLSLLAPGVATSGAIALGTGPSVGGQRPRNNNFTVEGLDNNSGAVTGPLVQVPNDAVAEFTFLENQFGADFGHSSGGQFNQVVKSGTNQFHGSGYEYFINKNLLATDNLNAVAGSPLHPRYDNNRFGGTFGGPIKKNKLFFFVDYEYNPVGSVGQQGALCAPTAAGYSLINGIPGINKTNLSQLQKYVGTAPAASTPAACGNSANPLVGPGNASLGEQSASAISIPIGLVSFTSPAYNNYESGVAALDYNISDKDSLRGRFILNRTGGIDTNGFPSTFYATVPFNYYLATFSEFHTFSPSVVNEFRFGYNRYFNVYPVPSISFPGLDAFPNIDVFELGGVNNTFGPDPNAPQGGIQNQYQLSENLSWTKGKHSFKFGFDGWKQISPQLFVQRSRGDYEWSYLSDYLFDYNPDYLAQRSLGGAEYYGDRILTSYYASDAWKVLPNLTLNIGVRYEYQTIPYSERQQTLNAISNVPGLITFGKPQPQGDAIMPRIGIAYSPGKSGTTSIRAGYGLFYDVLYDNQGLLTVPPQFSTTVDVTGLDQSGFLANGGIKPNTSGMALTQAQARAGTAGYVPNGTRPETSSWNVGVQHTFHNNYILETRYVGTHSVHLSVQDQLNRQPVVNASNALPLFLTAPSQAVLNGLTNTLSTLTTAYNKGGNIIPGFYNAGFTGIITSYQPWGRSFYNGLQNSLTRRFSNGLQFNAAYTWSHALDDSTADVFSTYATPRRPQDARNVKADYSPSALDHRQRFTLEAIYDLPFFKNGNWFMKNVVGNWEVAPIYTYQTGTLVDVQSGVDSNLNGDTAGDRAFVNPSGVPNTGSGATALKNSAGQTVAYVANNPNAEYIQAPKGTIPNSGRNTAQLRPIDDIDLTIAKSFNITEGKKIQFSARFINIFNHPQYVGGYLSDVAPAGLLASPTGADVSPNTQAIHSFLEPQNASFLQPTQAFSSNPRQLSLALKFIF